MSLLLLRSDVSLQIAGCERPLKLTDFVAHPGMLVSIGSELPPGSFLELLGLIKNVSFLIAF